MPDTNKTTLPWHDLPGLSASLAISLAAAHSPGPLLVVTENNEQVEQLRRELGFLCPGGKLPVLSFPDWETLPYDNFSAHQDITSDRLDTLYRLPDLDRGILVVSFTSLMHRLPPRHYITSNSLILECGQRFDIDTMRSTLAKAGYQAVEAVFEHGEFAVRGSIMDIFPMGSQLPYRIDLLGDEIETLRPFDPETQRSLGQVDEIRLLPGKEFPLNERGILQFRTRFRERFDVDTRSCPLYQDVSDGIASPGLEYYLALFFEELSSLVDFLPEQTRVIRLGRPDQAGDEFWNEIRTRHQDRQIDRYRPVLDPGEVFLSVSDVYQRLNRFPTVTIDNTTAAGSGQFGFRDLPDLTINARLQEPLARLADFIAAQADSRILLCAESAGRRETLLELFRTIDLQPKSIDSWQDFQAAGPDVYLSVAPLDRGFWLPAAGTILISEAQLFGGKIAQRRRRGKTSDNTEFVIKSLTELREGDAVVHVEHGVGRYRGLTTLTIDNQDTEFLLLEYAGESKLYVPVSSLHLVSRYTGADPDLAPLNRLGSDAWKKARRRAAEKIRDVAAELLEIYARREARKGFPYNCDEIGLDQFADSFPFEETDDQASAIKAVIDDMSSERAMDRLICGDVGFGKTEVAMRAAFIAAQNHKQVAILVPTTLLAQQHFSSFSDRFADWPINVDVISRFNSTQQQKLSLENLAAGKTDVLIGTHKLLNGEIKYHDLGLLIIDEEHRFGVRQKEKLKALRANVDVLTLTATPIPRTLNMALSGVRDLSLIVTPPARRLSVKTFIREEQDSLVKEAVLRELLRGGQVFFLHNEVKTIQQAARHLEEIVPQARITVAHGQMPERELEKVMADFYHKRFNVLVCSTIIETGIDIPSANTIIIHRADKFGLAQLHQLRGRVGRSHHQAYAYLLTPHQAKMSDDAHKRVDAIKAASALGAGFTLASHDLEIRGAGEFLGEEQSGHMQKIGFTLYLEMLDEAVKSLRAGKTPALDFSSEKDIDINLRIPALIPEQYLPDVHTRLVMYKRISAADDDVELTSLQEEMIDRFGLLPNEVRLLFRLTRLKLQALPLGISKIDANVSSGRIEFGPATRVDPLSIVELVQQDPQHYKLGSANQLLFSHDAQHDAGQRLDLIAGILKRIRVTEQQAA
ncbi:MAG: transcription-repair coupling factor [Pseudomonadales bacterium]|nr:transcription-repair coupling factor [Pseudomonadales bacterium]